MRTQITRSTRKYRAKRRKVSRSIKHFLLILAVVAGAWVLVSGSKKVARPFLLYIAESRENHRIEQEIAELKSQNAALLRKVIHLRKPQGAATESRTLGWVRKGEVSIVVVPKDKE